MADGQSTAEYLQGLRRWMVETLKVPSDFFDLPNDDWTLIIKLTAMVEAAMNNAIRKQFGVEGNEDAEKVFELMDGFDVRKGKLALACSLEMLTEEQKRFAIILSNLRNRCAHGTDEFGFDLREELSSLKATDEAAYLRWLRAVIFDPPDRKRKQIVTPEMQAAADDPRLAIFGATMHLMMALQVHDQQCKQRNLQHQMNQIQSRLFEEQTESTPTEPKSPP